MLVSILNPQRESPVSSCLAWASAAHKHTGGPLLNTMGIHGDMRHGGMSHGFNPTRKPPQSGCENWKARVLQNDDPRSKLTRNQKSLSSAFQSTIGTSSQTLDFVLSAHKIQRERGNYGLKRSCTEIVLKEKSRIQNFIRMNLFQIWLFWYGMIK